MINFFEKLESQHPLKYTNYNFIEKKKGQRCEKNNEKSFRASQMVRSFS